MIYSKEAMEQMKIQMAGKPVTLGIGGPVIGEVTGAEISDGEVRATLKITVEEYKSVVRDGKRIVLVSREE